MQEVSAPMKTTVKRTLLGAALLAALAAVLPFLCLVPLFAPGQAAAPDNRSRQPNRERRGHGGPHRPNPAPSRGPSFCGTKPRARP